MKKNSVNSFGTKGQKALRTEFAAVNVATYADKAIVRVERECEKAALTAAEKPLADWLSTDEDDTYRVETSPTKFEIYVAKDGIDGTTVAKEYDSWVESALAAPAQPEDDPVDDPEDEDDDYIEGLDDEPEDEPADDPEEEPADEPEDEPADEADDEPETRAADPEESDDSDEPDDSDDEPDDTDEPARPEPEPEPAERTYFFDKSKEETDAYVDDAFAKALAAEGIEF
jgi:hypothetical protein